MKLKTFYITSFLTIASAALFLGNSNGRAAGGGADSTGGNGTGTCANCHSGGTYNPTIVVTFLDSAGTNAVTAWLPNKTYTVRVRINAANGTPAGYGFQMIDYRGANIHVKGWAAAGHSSNVQISTLGQKKLAEHNTRSTTNTFDVKWVAPAAGSGTVTFFVAGNAVNGGASGTAGDSPTNTSVTFAEGRVNTNDLNINLQRIAISPNPVANMATLQLESKTARQLEVTIVDASGRTLRRQMWSVTQGDNQTTLPISDLSVGIYFVRLADGQDAVARMFQKY